MILLQNPKELPSLYQPYAFLTLLMGERIPLMTSTIPSYISVVLFFGQKGDKKKKDPIENYGKRTPVLFPSQCKITKKTHTRTVSSLSAVSEYGRRGKRRGGRGNRRPGFEWKEGLGKESFLQTADESLSPILLTIWRGLLLRYIQWTKPGPPHSGYFYLFPRPQSIFKISCAAKRMVIDLITNQ